MPSSEIAEPACYWNSLFPDETIFNLVVSSTKIFRRFGLVYCLFLALGISFLHIPLLKTWLIFPCYSCYRLASLSWKFPHHHNRDHHNHIRYEIIYLVYSWYGIRREIYIFQPVPHCATCLYWNEIEPIIFFQTSSSSSSGSNSAQLQANRNALAAMMQMPQLMQAGNLLRHGSLDISSNNS